MDIYDVATFLWGMLVGLLAGCGVVMFVAAQIDRAVRQVQSDQVQNLREGYTEQGNDWAAFAEDIATLRRKMAAGRAQEAATGLEDPPPLPTPYPPSELAIPAFLRRKSCNLCSKVRKFLLKQLGVRVEA